MKETEARLDFVKADGGREKASEEHVLAVRSAIESVRTDIADHVQSKREASQNDRLCRWAGQSPDGRKREDYLGRPAKPFEGASDTQPFTIDKVINYIVAELSTAVLRAIPRDMGMESTDGKVGGYNSTLIKWLVKNQWSQKFRRQAKLLANYTYGDSPAGAVLWVDWEEQREVVLETLTVDELLEKIVEVMPNEPTEAEGEILIDVVSNPERRIELRMLLQAHFPQLSKKRINRMVKELYEKEQCEFPIPRVKCSRPDIAALRQFDDVIFPRDVTELQESPWIIKRDRLTAAQVREEAAKFEWSKAFVDDLLETGKGRSVLTDDLDMRTNISEGADSGLYGMDERYEVLHVYSRAVNEDGIPGIYWQTVSCFVDVPATDRILFDRDHGNYPCIHSQRETLSAAIADGRSVGEILRTVQNSIKLLDDSFEDHVQEATGPVRKIPAGAPPGTYSFAPFSEIEMGPREGNAIGYLDPPKYPSSNKDHYQRQRRHIGEYWGIPYEDVDEVFVQLFSQDRIDTFLGVFAEAYMMSLQLIDQFMEPEQISQITGQPVEEIEQKSRRQIQGRYNISLTFDARDLNGEYLLKLADAASGPLRSLDDNKLIDSSGIAVNILERMDPNLAQGVVRSRETADAAEASDEKKNLALMMQGIRPNRPDDNRAQNFPIRLQVLQQELQLRQANPGAFPEISPAAAAIIQEQLEYLGFQTQQRENAQTGRLGFTETDLMAIGQPQGQPVRQEAAQ